MQPNPTFIPDYIKPISKVLPMYRYIPVDTRRKLNVHRTFRRRPGPLLNDLSTFNLRPVSMGIIVAIIYFSWKISPKQYHALDTIFTDAKTSNIFYKCNYDSQRFQVFT